MMNKLERYFPSSVFRLCLKENNDLASISYRGDRNTRSDVDRDVEFHSMLLGLRECHSHQSEGVLFSNGYIALQRQDLQQSSHDTTSSHVPDCLPCRASRLLEFRAGGAFDKVEQNVALSGGSYSSSATPFHAPHLSEHSNTFGNRLSSCLDGQHCIDDAVASDKTCRRLASHRNGTSIYGSPCVGEMPYSVDISSACSCWQCNSMVCVGQSINSQPNCGDVHIVNNCGDELTNMERGCAWQI